MFDFLLSNKQEHIDRLFNFKIHLFEQDIVKNCKDEDIKSSIESFKHLLMFLNIFLQIWVEAISPPTRWQATLDIDFD